VPDYTPALAPIAAQIRVAEKELDLAIATAFVRGFDGLHNDLSDIQLELERVRSSLVLRPNARSHRKARPAA